MKVIAGLGNPGRDYAHTPHNVGFEVVEILARRWECELRQRDKFNARMGRTVFAGSERWLLEPMTYMNLSGQSVAEVLRYHGWGVSDLIVVLDDADLERGDLRIRPRGRSGGHRGLDSIIQSLGDDGFARVRIGIGRGCPGENLVSHVLGKLSVEDKDLLGKTVSAAADAIEYLLEQGVDAAMNRFNTRRSAGAKDQEERRGGEC